MVITCYDETAVDARAVNLTNQVGTITIVPVNFSYPAGSFRVESDLVFTHFTAIATAAAGDHVYKITGFTAINEKVIEYYYQLDYLKDYFYKYGDGSLGSLPLEDTLVKSYYSTDSALAEFRLPFPVNTHVSSVASSTEEKTGIEMDVVKPYFVMMTADTTLAPQRIALKTSTDPGTPLTTKAIYTMSNIVDLDEIYQVLLKREMDLNDPDEYAKWDNGTFTSFYSNIVNAFYAPTAAPGNTHLVSDNYIFYIANDGSRRFKDFTNTALKDKLYYVKLPSFGTIQEAIDTTIDITLNNANDLPPFKTYKIFVPYLGFYDLPLGEMFYDNFYAATYRLVVKYFYDLLNGQVACQFGLRTTNGTLMSSYRTPFVPLPSLALPTSSYAAQSIAADNAYNTSKTATAISSLGQMAIGAVTGNPLVIASGFATGVTGMMNASIQNEQSQANAHLGNFTSGTDSSVGITDRRFRVYVNTYKTALTLSDAAKIYGYPSNQFRNTIQFDNLNKSKFWLDTSASKVIGPQWYTDGVRAEYASDYVTFIPAP